MNLKTFPKGCVGFCRPKKFKFIPWGIMQYSKWKEHIPKRYRVSHCFMLWEKNLIHESTLNGNQERNIEKYMNKDWEIWLFRNDQMGAKQYAQGRGYSQGRIGLPYDIPNFVRFLIKWIPQVKWADVCSEFQSMVVRLGLMLPWVRSIKDLYKITPSKAFSYAISNIGKEDCWNLLFYWNGKELLNQYD